jgi:uncharacterized phiE125 gp8 family phage protein
VRLSLVGYGSDQDNLSADIPLDEPITLDDAKAQVRREDVSIDDEYLQNILIPAVRERAERETSRQLISATWDLMLDRFPCPDDLSAVDRWTYPQGVIRVPLPPLQSVVRITYVDPDGVTQTWATDQYVVDAPAGPKAGRARITPAYGVIWPCTRCQIAAVTVRFVAGYGDDHSSVPPRVKMGMLLDLATLYENREDQVIGQGIVVASFAETGSTAIYRAFKSY